VLKESGLNKLKNLTSSKSTSKSSRSEEEHDSSDTGATTSAPRSKVKSKGQEAALPSQRLSSASSSSSSTASTAPIKPKEEEPKEEGGEKGGASNLFEKFLLNCEAKDRVPRRQADQNKNATPKVHVYKALLEPIFFLFPCFVKRQIFSLSVTVTQYRSKVECFILQKLILQ